MTRKLMMIARLLMKIATLMMMLVKLRNWYCVGRAQVMRRISAFKVTEDIDPYFVIQTIIMVRIIIIVITIMVRMRIIMVVVMITIIGH